MVLIGGGIGITPMLSMLNWCLTEQPGCEVWLFHSVRDGREVTMKPRLAALAAADPNFHLGFCFSKPLPEELAGRDCHYPGRIDLPLLCMGLVLKPHHFYIYGPAPLMESMAPALDDWGVPEAPMPFAAFGAASVVSKQAATSSAVRP